MEDELKNFPADIRGNPIPSGDNYVEESETASPPYREDEEATSGSATDPERDDDTTEMIEDFFGNKPEPGKPFLSGDEVAKDEAQRRGIEDSDDVEESLIQAENEISSEVEHELNRTPDYPDSAMEVDNTPPDDKQ
jgi:hypothetical protein